jgi:hypothetical protein
MVSLGSLDIRISIIITLKSDLSYDLRDFGTQPTQVVGVICNLETFYIHDDPLSAVAQQHDLSNTDLARTSFLFSLNILFPKLFASFPAAPTDRHNIFI